MAAAAEPHRPEGRAGAPRAAFRAAPPHDSWSACYRRKNEMCFRNHA
ncbi:hypothetical protein C7S16_5506 [Burkholderia thailandensis]|uniref:Uncharacterized protein n=1 Tax=Burkholderia thailandensis TaxID=57975 RepID=A0AAW9CJR2_BURTH|nr:hypothetical protein [Burkholderia thailandensis]